MTTTHDQPELLTRREAVLRVSALFGGVALVGQAAMLAGARRSEAQAREALFTESDVALLDEIADTILPETDTPGAKAAAVGPFMALMVTDVYYPQEQEIFLTGLKDVDERCRAAHGTGFEQASAGQRLSLLQGLDKEQYEHTNDGREPAHYFRMMKELALLGYFTSEIGYTEAMRYAETPGRFDPCADYEPGDKAWARHA
jgi:hypothetical protein